ncbi:MAG: Eco57I restriction-modification methylase domain-containing protein, partial [Tepidisphaeraceae bacterium]
MGKRESRSGQAAPFMSFVEERRRRHPRLFLAKLLSRETHRLPVDAAEYERVGNLLRAWADLADAGHLGQKETSLDAEFLEKIFGDALGYRSVSESPTEYHRERQFTVAGAGTADGALGMFASGKTVAPTAIIELKGADTDLDHDKFNNRTPVQQLFDYLRELPDTPWGILSNYVTIRLYHRDKTTRAYEEFTVNDFREESRLREFYYVFERHGLLGNRLPGETRAVQLLKNSITEQREVGDGLYKYYSEQRSLLIETLMQKEEPFNQEQAIFAAQRLLDRVIFIAFCEDRGLLPKNLIENTWRSVAPLELATNPRWRKFLEAFRAIDKGHPALDLPTGYNGGLFKRNELIDDLNLDDRWADVFKNIGVYDFSEGGDINVDVLGHIFERSISDLERRRTPALFGMQAEETLARMPKSAERKRFGTYYTPPQFTGLIVENTLGRLIAERVEPLENPIQRVKAIRSLTVCDPACGSGAFLIAAYQRFEDAYEEAVRLLLRAGLTRESQELAQAYPDYILAENLYGVDVSEQSVEITQLALWIRSARKGTPLSDLSQNIVCANSLVRDASVHERAFVWQDKFPNIFKSQRQGFDCVIGNPPWERMKLQEREFFALAAPDIAGAVNAAQRRKLIAAVESGKPELWKRYQSAQASAARTLDYVRNCGHFPLTGKGDVNTYMVFAELARQLVAPTGRVGLLVPSGIATDDTTKEFFASLIHHQSLIALYDFENKLGIFADVHRAFKF